MELRKLIAWRATPSRMRARTSGRAPRNRGKRLSITLRKAATRSPTSSRRPFRLVIRREAVILVGALSPAIPGSTPNHPCSELKLERQLDRARSADLVERVETAILATGPEAARQGLRRAAEQRAGQVAVGISEVRVVQDVEEFSPKTKPN